METRTWFHPSLQLCYTRVSGLLDYTGVAAMRSAISRDSRHELQNRHLLDLREVKGFNLTSDELRDLAMSAVHAPDAKRAIVAGTSRLTFGMARMADAWYDRTRPQGRVFTQLEEALEWLEVPLTFDLQAGSPLITRVPG